MKKRAFTFAELMISLLLISIIAAILYPTLAHFRPNNNKPLFKSAYRILTTAISEIVNERADGELPLCLNTISTDITPANNTYCYNIKDRDDIKENKYHYSAVAFCRAFCEKMNMAANSTTSCITQCRNCQITTSNGMRWAFERYYTDPTYLDPMTPNSETNKIPGVFKIWVDVNSSNNSLDSDDNCGSPIDDSSKGVFCYLTSTDANNGIYNTNPSGTFNIEHLKAQDTFIILINPKGKIVSMSPAGWANLEDDELNPD